MIISKTIEIRLMIYIYRLITNLLYPFFIILIYLRKLFNKEDHNRYKEKIFTSEFLPDRDKKKTTYLVSCR